METDQKRFIWRDTETTTSSLPYVLLICSLQVK